MNTTRAAARRLAEAVRCTADIDLRAVEDALFLEPNQLRPAVLYHPEYFPLPRFRSRSAT